MQIALYNDATSGSNVRNMEAADIKFNMNIGCIRVVFLNRFVMDLLVRKAICDLPYEKGNWKKTQTRLNDLQTHLNAF